MIRGAGTDDDSGEARLGRRGDVRGDQCRLARGIAESSLPRAHQHMDGDRQVACCSDQRGRRGQSAECQRRAKLEAISAS